MDVSKNSGTPKSSNLIGFSIIFTIRFGGVPPILGNTHIICRAHAAAPSHKNWCKQLNHWLSEKLVLAVPMSIWPEIVRKSLLFELHPKVFLDDELDFWVRNVDYRMPYCSKYEPTKESFYTKHISDALKNHESCCTTSCLKKNCGKPWWNGRKCPGLPFWKCTNMALSSSIHSVVTRILDMWHESMQEMGISHLNKKTGVGFWGSLLFVYRFSILTVNDNWTLEKNWRLPFPPTGFFPAFR